MLCKYSLIVRLPENEDCFVKEYLVSIYNNKNY